MWIQHDSGELQLWILIITHCCFSGHRCAKVTASVIGAWYKWNSFAKVQIHSYQIASIASWLRLAKKNFLGLSLIPHCTQLNEILHFDYLYICPSAMIVQYIFVIKDDLSSYIWFVPTESADAENAAKSLSRSICSLAAKYHPFSDQSSHFKNQIMEFLASSHRIHHQFTVVYSLWVNGTVENVNRNIQATTHALSTRIKSRVLDWHKTTSLIQFILYRAPLRTSRNVSSQCSPNFSRSHDTYPSQPPLS